MEIFFIDDDLATNRFHELILSKSISALNLKASFFDNPIGVVNLFKESNKFPDYIFLDINMPGMDGWEFLEAYKENQFPEEVIIIILTSSQDPRLIQKANENPLVNEFRVKPLNSVIFEEVIKTYDHLINKDS